MASFQAADSIVLDRQLKVQSVKIPFTITHSATPASKVISTFDPSILFLDTQGLNQITIASGALETGETLPSLATPTDSTGVFAALVKIRESLQDVVSVKLVARDASGVLLPCEILAFTTGSAHSGQSIVVNVRSTIDLATTDLNCSLECEYVVVSE